jgi:rRNA maturation protein Nop10
MKEPVYAGATAMLCHHCGGSVLTWSPDRWLAAHEQVFKCGGCGRLHLDTRTLHRTGPVAHPAHPPRVRH